MVLGNLSNKLFIMKQKSILLKELKRLESQYKLTRNFPEYGISEDENIQEVERVQENLGLQKNIKNLISETKSSLKKIDKDKYGYCDKCKNQIEQDRLIAYPSAGLCMKCAKEIYNK